jgi:hypothetical protein
VKLNKTIAIVAVLVVAAAECFAQGPARNQSSETVLIGAMPGQSPGLPIPDDTLLRLRLEDADKLVKGAPYTATAHTETIQTMADGNRIVNRSTTLGARDSEGRTRREESLMNVGSLQADAPKTIMLTDPTAHTHYVFTQGKIGSTERAFMIDDGGAVGGGKKVFSFGMGDGQGAGEGNNVRFITRNTTVNKSGGGEGDAARGTATAVMAAEVPESDVKHESLGTQAVEGIPATGIRDTRTIPAGAIGNDKPIVITSEVWTSPDLQVVVQSKRVDPRFGETNYKLTDIARGEPDASLFQVPANIKKDLPAGLK